MKKIISLICLALVLCLMLGTLTGCHGKDETAVTIDGHKITSAVYMCTLIQADQEARNKVYTALSAEDDFDSSADIDYWSQTVEEKTYDTWVRDRALELCKVYVATIIKCEELGVTLTDDQVANIEYNASYNWSTNGYAYLYEVNGVSFDSYLEYYKNSALSSAYFLKLYGEGGEKEVTEDEINEAIGQNYDLMNYLMSSFTTDDGEIKEDSVTTAEKAKLENLAGRITAGTLTFAAASDEWDKYNNVTSEETDNTVTDEEAEETEEGSAPLDSTAVLLASSTSGSSYASEYFDQIHALKIGEATVITEDNAYVLVVRKNVMDDPYYVKNLKSEALSILKYDEFSEAHQEYAKALEAKVSNFAIKQFKVKEIDYSQYESYAASQSSES